MVTRKKTKKATKKSSNNESVADFAAPPPNATIGDSTGVQTTGRFIVIFKDDAAESKTIRSTLNQVAGLKDITSSSDFSEGAVPADDLANSDVVHFDKLGIAVVSADQDIQALAASMSDSDSAILAIEPEFIAYPSQLASPTLPAEYLRGYRDAVNQLYDGLVNGASAVAEAEILETFRDTAEFTWGLQATRVNSTQVSGQGIKVAVLDTGLDLQHPDFQGRAITTKSFVSGVTVQDIHGHGTHCIGTACGPQRPASGVRRYGIAFGAQIFAGKVFNNNMPRPGAPTASVIAGIEWAMTNGCRVASLSLGAPVNQKILQYEVPVRRALQGGTLVIAAAGNNAERPAEPGFVEPPANADAAMAVAAIDKRLRIAEFSARSSQLTGVGGLVNIAAPGVDVFSSVPVARGKHGLKNGTSMATPHVAGIAALWAQVTGESGNALWNRLLQSVRPLNLPSVDVGAGLVQAPQ
jgi:subtilisin family serine protease